MIWFLQNWKIIVVLLAITGAWMEGYQQGKGDCEAAQRIAEAVESKAREETAAKLAAAENRARLLARELEDAAYAEPPAAAACLPRARVLRLDNR